MGVIECRATVNLPPDASGRGPAPGDVVWVDDADEQVDRWIRLSYLVPVVRLPMPEGLIPARARVSRAGGSGASEGAQAARPADGAEERPDGAS